jgi:hypothetical protein
VVDTEFAELLRHALLSAMQVGAPVLVVAFVVRVWVSTWPGAAIAPKKRLSPCVALSIVRPSKASNVARL